MHLLRVAEVRRDLGETRLMPPPLALDIPGSGT